LLFLYCNFAQKERLGPVLYWLLFFCSFQLLSRGKKAESVIEQQHIMDAHGDDFASMGVSQKQIPGVVMQAVTRGKIVGYQGAGAGRVQMGRRLRFPHVFMALFVRNRGQVLRFPHVFFMFGNSSDAAHRQAAISRLQSIARHGR
jgi:hypothetical protein